MFQRQNKLMGFTLVELIVVITIVGILSTVGFVSYSGYLTGARDSNRISQMVKISDSLQVYSATRSLPLPDNNVEIHASGSLIAYQGEVGIDVLETIDFTNGGTDPKDDSFYTYYLTKDRNSLQLMALMEEQQSVTFNNSNTSLNSLLTGEMKLHAQFEERFPKVYGRKLGALTQVDTNIPIQQLTTFNSAAFEILTETGYTAHISDDEKIDGLTAGDLSGSITNGSCKRIKQTGGSDGNGVYTIKPAGEDFQVYCDMETDGGGWTAATMLADTTTQNLFDTGNTEKITSITTDISSKGTISDIWRDNKSKDIMIRCSVDGVSGGEKYESPFVIKQFLSSDITHLEKTNKSGTTLSSQSLTANWRSETYSLSTNWGSFGSQESHGFIHLGNRVFSLSNGTRLFYNSTFHNDSPAYSDSVGFGGPNISVTNYCVTYIK